ncbi:MAG: hypothetical protein QXE27_06975, partial [Thermoplasmata archaeon]
YIVATTVVDGQTYTASYGSREQPHSFTTETAITVLQVEDYYEPARDENGVRVWWEMPGVVGKTQYAIRVIEGSNVIYQTEVELAGEIQSYEIPENVGLARNVEYKFSVSATINGKTVVKESIGAISDYDGDGLTDGEELHGWDITIYSWNGISRTPERWATGHVHSRPDNPNSDNDGWNDKEEKEHQTKPLIAATGGGGGGGRPPLICSVSNIEYPYDPSSILWIDGTDTDCDGIRDNEDWKMNSKGFIVKSPLITEPNRRAVIVCGGTTVDEVNVLENDGVSWKVYLEDIGWDVDIFGVGHDKTIITNRISTYAHHLFQTDMFLLMFICHGGYNYEEKKYIVECGNSYITNENLRGLVADFEGKLVTFMITCHSDGINDVWETHPDNRVFIGASQTSQEAYYSWYYHMTVFSWWFLEKGMKGGGISNQYHPDNNQNTRHSLYYYYDYINKVGRYINDPHNINEHGQQVCVNPVCYPSFFNLYLWWEW